MPSSSKRRHQDDEERRNPRAKKQRHLYLVLDDWKDGYSIHKLDAENMAHFLPQPAALRVAAPDIAPMAFAAVGTSILIANKPPCSRDQRARQIMVYDTETAALGFGPSLPDWHLPDLGTGMAAGDKLYALTWLFDEQLGCFSSLQVLSREPVVWDPTMMWSWNRALTSPPNFGHNFEHGRISSYALHPDGRTIFMSIEGSTYTFDTSNGVCRCVGEWALPFRGQAYFDGDLDAWVGLHHNENGYLCCCPVASRSAAAAGQPDCKMLREKLFRRGGEEKYPKGRYLGATLTYMGNSRFCLAESVLRHPDRVEAVLHITLFGLKYDQMGELQTTTRRTTRSYALSKRNRLFSHALFWM
ncbi:hypothetical protein ACP70R_005589 [Stipagrostis hirtigluma subsp. patula]